MSPLALISTYRWIGGIGGVKGRRRVVGGLGDVVGGDGASLICRDAACQNGDQGNL